jgi:hypothetical protein
MKTLYDKLKPHIKDKLKSQVGEYSVSINNIFSVLKNKHMYSQLTIDELRAINTFTDVFLMDLTQTDLIYGEYLLND